MSMSQIANAAASGISPSALQHSLAYGGNTSVPPLNNPQKAASSISNQAVENIRRKTLEAKTLASIIGSSSTSEEMQPVPAAVIPGVRGLMELRERDNVQENVNDDSKKSVKPSKA